MANLPQCMVIVGKGGDAKTTTTASLGDALARVGSRRVLIVDFDQQVSLTSWLCDEPVTRGIEDFLLDWQHPGTEGLPVDARVRLSDLVRPLREPDERSRGTVHLVPATRGLANLDPFELPHAMHELLLQAAHLGYDLLILDTHSFSPQGDDVTLHLPALSIADDVVLAFQPSSMSMLALVDVIDDITSMQPREQSRQPRARLWVLPTRVPRTRSAYLALEQVRQQLSHWVLPPITAAVAADDAVGAGRLLADFAPDSKPNRSYVEAAQAMLARLAELDAGQKVEVPA